MSKQGIRGVVLGALLSAVALPSAAQQVTPSQFDVDVNVLVLPTASVSFIGNGLLYLRVPPPSSTNHLTGVTFSVTGNAWATLVAEPSEFMTATTVDYGPEHLGKAVLNNNPIGYRVSMEFPVTGIVNSPRRTSQLPGYEDGPTDPPLTVNLLLTGGSRNGRLHIETSERWTPNGSIPLPGIYVGEVFLTVTASN